MESDQLIFFARCLGLAIFSGWMWLNENGLCFTSCTWLPDYSQQYVPELVREFCFQRSFDAQKIEACFILEPSERMIEYLLVESVFCWWNYMNSHFCWLIRPRFRWFIPIFLPCWIPQKTWLDPHVFADLGIFLLVQWLLDDPSSRMNFRQRGPWRCSAPRGLRGDAWRLEKGADWVGHLHGWGMMVSTSRRVFCFGKSHLEMVIMVIYG